MSVFGNQSPCGDKVCPTHLWTPLRLVLAEPVCLATSSAQMPGHNRWINTKTRNNYKGLLPFPDKTEQPFHSRGCRIVLLFRDGKDWLVEHWTRTFSKVRDRGYEQYGARTALKVFVMACPPTGDIIFVYSTKLFAWLEKNRSLACVCKGWFIWGYLKSLLIVW